MLLRLEGANSEEKVKVLREILEKYSDRILGRFCVYKDGKLRIRRDDG